MKKMLQLFVIIFILTGIALGAWYAGGVALAVTLGVLGLTGLIAIADGPFILHLLQAAPASIIVKIFHHQYSLDQSFCRMSGAVWLLRFA